MKTLYLLRHAHAVTEAPPLMGDHERVLSDKGTVEAEKVAAFMKEAHLCPDFILSSTAARTIQTARIVMGSVFETEGRKVDTLFDRKLYLAEPSAIIEDIRTTKDDYDNLLVVGHNPGMAELAKHLSDNNVVDFPTGALAVFECKADTWDEFDMKQMQLKQVFVP